MAPRATPRKREVIALFDERDAGADALSENGLFVERIEAAGSRRSIRLERREDLEDVERGERIEDVRDLGTGLRKDFAERAAARAANELFVFGAQSALGVEGHAHALFEARARAAEATGGLLWREGAPRDLDEDLGARRPSEDVGLAAETTGRLGTRASARRLRPPRRRAR